jgi:hypothetical protein
LFRAYARPGLRRTQLQVSRSQMVRAFSWIGHLPSCIVGKRSVKCRGVDADEGRLSNGEGSREQPGEQNGSASIEAAHLKPPAWPAAARQGLSGQNI